MHNPLQTLIDIKEIIEGEDEQNAQNVALELARSHDVALNQIYSLIEETLNSIKEALK